MNAKANTIDTHVHNKDRARLTVPAVMTAAASNGSHLHSQQSRE